MSAALALGVPLPALQLLLVCGAAARPHSSRTLLHHLVGTYALLKQWGADEDTSLGGLFHSVYGTNAFRHESLAAAERATLQALIGSRAEHLAWTFCHVNRPQAILDALREVPQVVTQVTPADWQALAAIECANLMEQQTSITRLREFFCLAMDRPGSLPDVVVASLRKALATHAQRVSGATAAAPHNSPPVLNILES